MSFTKKEQQSLLILEDRLQPLIKRLKSNIDIKLKDIFGILQKDIKKTKNPYHHYHYSSSKARIEGLIYLLNFKYNLKNLKIVIEYIQIKQIAPILGIKFSFKIESLKKTHVVKK